jgi:putative peptidoglycan lipid II flippase
MGRISYRVVAMTQPGADGRSASSRAGGWAQGRAHDPDDTVTMPAVTDDAHDVTEIIPVVSLDSDRSIGFAYNVGGVTAEHPVVPVRPRSAEPEVETSVARHGAVMASGSIISRVTGFLRTATIGAVIGAIAIGNDYNLANTLPGMVYELLLGGVLASVVIPLLVRARTRDADRGEAYAQRLLTLAVVFLAGATVVAVLFAPVFTFLLAGRATPPDDRSLITTLSFLLLPMIFFYGLAALFAAILNTRGHFAMPTFAPILNNLVVIGMMLSLLFFSPVLHPKDAASLSATQVAVLGAGTTLGIIVQAAALLPALRRVGFAWRWRWDFRQLHLREIGRVSVWMLAYVVASQIALVVVLRLAQTASHRALGAAGPAIFNNAFLIFMMAHGIVAVSIITALMPRMAAAAAENRHEDLVSQLSLGTRLTAVVLVPTTAAYVVLGRPLAVSLFQYGNYTHDAAIATGWVIAVAGLGLVPFAISQLQLFAFYAMPDTKTPALVNIPVVILRIVVDLLLFVVLPAGGVAAGLMGGNAISFVLAAVLGYWLLRQRVGLLGMRQIVSTIARLGFAALVACVPALIVVIGLTTLWTDDRPASYVELVLGGIVLIGTYIAVAFALRVQEVRDLAGMLRARLGR